MLCPKCKKRMKEVYPMPSDIDGWKCDIDGTFVSVRIAYSKKE